ncbi:MAG: potassium transporter TrkA [Thermoanaerobaculia bacterium]
MGQPPTHRQPTLRERLAYAFDSSLAGGPAVLIGWLGVVSLLLIAVLSLVVWGTGIAPASDEGRAPGFVQIVWMSLMRTLDAGTMGGDAGSWWFLFAMLVVTFGGIFVISTLIGALTGVIEEKMGELRKGRSRVLERGHTLILGWSPRIFTIVSELATANENQRRACVVILADRDKVEMEDELRERVGDTKTTRIVCRSGNPADMGDLEIANVQGSKSIVLLPPPGSDPDIETIKTLLAITNSPNRRREPYHVVAEIRDPKNLAVARMVGRGEVELVLVPELLARVTVQTCRQSGLSLVYQELLDFGGDEIYFKREPALAGATFGDILARYPDSSVLGLRRADGEIRLNPPMDTVVGPGDEVIAVSEDDDTVVAAPTGGAVLEDAIVARPAPRPPQPERTLILGWNRKTPIILREMDRYVSGGSQVLVVAAFAEGRETYRAQCPAVTQLRLELRAGDITDRATLDALAVPSFDHVILLSPASDESGGNEQQADAQTLVTLLHLRDIEEKSGGSFSIVSEMLDVRNRALAEVTRADDFIVGDQLASLLLTQISENKQLNAVFADLLDPEGSELYLKPAADYVRAGRELTFYTVVESARRRGEIAIGYRLQRHAGDPRRSYGVTTNPAKAERITFEEGDSVIVLAES